MSIHAIITASSEQIFFTDTSFPQESSIEDENQGEENMEPPLVQETNKVIM